MSDKVLLTGISGWIAKHTAIELLNSGYEVLGTVRNNYLIEQTKETISSIHTNKMTKSAAQTQNNSSKVIVNQNI